MVQCRSLFCIYYQWKREQEFDLQLLERAIRGEDKDENEWLKVQPVAVTETDLEPQDYDLDISREVTLNNTLPSILCPQILPLSKF